METKRIGYASPYRHGKATKMAKDMALKLAEFLPCKIEIEVISEETFKLRAENADLRKKLSHYRAIN